MAGYRVWMGYDYQADGEQVGLYTLPFYGDFASEEIAEEYRRRVANRDIIVRYQRSKPRRSCILDQDVRFLIGDPS